MEQNIDLDWLKKNITKLDVDVINLSKLIVKFVNERKNINEDSYQDKDLKQEQKIRAGEFKELKLEQKEKKEQLQICRNIYNSLIKENKTTIDRKEEMIQLLSGLRDLVNIETFKKPVQSVNIKTNAE